MLNANEFLSELYSRLDAQNPTYTQGQIPLYAFENNELAQFQINVRKEFFNKLRPILEDYAKENSIDIILKKENLLIF